jgi:DoxX-like protein
METAFANASPLLTKTTTTQKKVWTARIVGGLITLFFLVDGVGKVLRLAPYVEGTAKVGYSPDVLVPLGLVLLACTVLYVIPRTAVLGAILLTGYLGGATATHVRLGQPFIVPVLFGVLVWGCLYLRDERIRSLLPFARPRA